MWRFVPSKNAQKTWNSENSNLIFEKTYIGAVCQGGSFFCPDLQRLFEHAGRDYRLDARAGGAKNPDRKRSRPGRQPLTIPTKKLMSEIQYIIECHQQYHPPHLCRPSHPCHPSYRYRHRWSLLQWKSPSAGSAPPADNLRTLPASEIPHIYRNL